jgi:hypothetical protein
MTFTASVTGCSTPNYLWYVFDGSNWIAQGTWTANNTFSWRPTTPGNYQVAYWVKQQGSTPANGITDAVGSVARTVR